MNEVSRLSRLAAASGLLLLAACSSAPPPAPAPVAVKERPLSPEAVAFNDTARFIAGLKGRPGGPFAGLEATQPWLDYAKGFEETWAQFEKVQGEPMRVFEQRELAPVVPKGSYVFYPFSGPDVLYMNAFFPGRAVYVMQGLEPTGTIRAANEFTPQEIADEMRGWSSAMQSIFKRSFFVTREMDQSFRGRVADGLLESICLLLARSGYTIEGIRHGNLGEDGAFVAVDAAAVKERDAKGRLKIKPMAVEVAFRKGATGDPQKLTYISLRLDPSFKTKPAFSRFLLALGNPDTLIKSASFVMHWNPTEAFRTQVLETSRLILQDDTGVPYRFLQPPDWNTKLFGEYSAPDKPFKNWYQKPLAAAFDEPGKATPLGFNLGYGAGRRPSSLILAKRTTALASK